MVIDNIELDPTNAEFNFASEFVLHTNKLVYLTGKAGTGKTTFLKYLRETVSRNMVILAPTGVAAINAGGQTIHSFFKIKPSIYPPIDNRLRERSVLEDPDKSTIYDYFQYNNEKLRIIKGLDLLIIDEISMVRCDLLDLVDRLLRVFRKRINEPFGGVQVLLIGDTFQLPPIADFEEWDILRKFYKSPFFFSANVIQNNKLVYIELKKIYRQSEQDFIDLLNGVRINNVTLEEIKKINSRYNPTFTPKANENYIVLATHNGIVDRTNSEKLEELKAELHNFEATVTGVFSEKNMPTDRVLSLKEGAQVMFIKNDKDRRYYNGKIAKVKSIQDNEIIVETSEGGCFMLDKEDWKNIKYTWNEKEKRIEEELIGLFIQYPIKLAWAITVHKSQGLTFEHVIADLGSAFAPGQVYVALSRCKTFNGLQLKTKIDRSVIKTDKRVLEFAQNEMPSTLIIKELNYGKADYYYKKVREALNDLNYQDAYVNFVIAMKCRNDLETNLFKRYFLVFAIKAGIFKSRYFDLIKKSEKIKEVNDKYERLQSENTELQESIVSLKEKNQQLVEQTRNNFDESKKQTDLLIKTYKEEIEIHKNTILELEIKIKQFDNEVNSRRNLKWYKKLF